jgi:predicted nucleic acid-binding protein
MRIFLDANILFAAALPKSRTGVFFMEFQKHAVLLTNVYAVEEARRNLAEKRPDALSNFERLLKHIEVTVTAITSLDMQLADKDIPILGGAIAGNATYLLTGDKRDFEALWGQTVRGVKIISPQMLADELIQKGLLKK